MEHTLTFTAIGSDSEEYIVLEFTEFRHVGTQTDPHAVMSGLKELRTSQGFAVNRLRKGEYLVVQTGIVLRSDSPNAP